jgi:hypothetical protein
MTPDRSHQAQTMIAQLQEQLNQKELEACALRAGIIALRRQIPHENLDQADAAMITAGIDAIDFEAAKRMNEKLTELSTDEILSLQNEAIDRVLKPDRTENSDDGDAAEMTIAANSRNTANAIPFDRFQRPKTND